MNFEWTNLDPMPVPQAHFVIGMVCRGWVEKHPEDVDLPWQKIVFKLLRHSAMVQGHSMFICHSREGFLISDFGLIARDDLAIPFHG